MSLDFAKLVGQGRAKALGVPWSAEELEAVLLLEQKRGISRLKAADFVRNGILTLSDFDKATKNGFVPKTVEEATKEVEETLKGAGQAAVKKGKKRSKK